MLSEVFWKKHVLGWLVSYIYIGMETTYYQIPENNSYISLLSI